MKKNRFLKIFAGGTLVTLLGGCISRIDKSATDKEQGEPFRCGKCGYLTRSKTDITEERCPRCRARRLAKLSEEEMAGYLEEE